MLKNASSLAIVGLDTAENGPSKVRQVTNRIDAIIAGKRGSGEKIRHLQPELGMLNIKTDLDLAAQSDSDVSPLAKKTARKQRTR